MYWENEMQELLETQDPDNEETYDGLVSEYEKVFAWTHQNKNDRCESATDPCGEQRPWAQFDV